MGLFNFWKKKKVQEHIISEEDQIKLKELERTAYMKEAETLILKRGQERAKRELSVKEEKEKWLM